MTVITKADRHYKGQQLSWSAREPNAPMFQIKFTERNRTCCRFFFRKLTTATVLKLCKEHFPTEKPWGRDSVTSRYHGSQISGSQHSSWQGRPFASSNDGRSRNNAEESHTFHAIHVRFFLSNLRICISSLSCKELYHGHFFFASWLRRERASKRGNRLGESRKQKRKQNKTS